MVSRHRAQRALWSNWLRPPTAISSGLQVPGSAAFDACNPQQPAFEVSTALEFSVDSLALPCTPNVPALMAPPAPHASWQLAPSRVQPQSCFGLGHPCTLLPHLPPASPRQLIAPAPAQMPTVPLASVTHLASPVAWTPAQPGLQPGPSALVPGTSRFYCGSSLPPTLPQNHSLPHRQLPNNKNCSLVRSGMREGGANRPSSR